MAMSSVPVRKAGFSPIEIFQRTLLIFLCSPVCSRQILFGRLSHVECRFVSLFVIE